MSNTEVWIFQANTCPPRLQRMKKRGQKSLKQKTPDTYQRKQMIFKGVPKGCLAIKVGQQQERMVVPVMYLNHPLFAQLLKKAEEEFGFAHQGTLTIPCQMEEFRYVQGIIGLEKSGLQKQHQHIVCCFRP